MSEEIINEPKIVNAYTVATQGSPFQLSTITRRALTEFDVDIKIEYCGICRSDWHHQHNNWKDVRYYELCTGHEIIGIVQNVGENAKKFKIGDRVCVGNFVDSCRHCVNCEKAQEQYCLNEPSQTYNGYERVKPDGTRTLLPRGARTQGGYSSSIVAQEDFVFHLPENLDPARSAPLMCAGITLYYPLKHWKMGRGHKVAIIGLGGLGHLGLKLAKAFQCEVVGITTSESKIPYIREQADDAIWMGSEEDQVKYKDYFDMIIDTIPVSHMLRPYLRMLKPNGDSKLHIVGNMNEMTQLNGIDFVFYGKNITGSNTGGTEDTEEMLAFCSEHRIMADIEIVQPEDINEAMTRMVNKEVRFRSVIDLRNL